MNRQRKSLPVTINPDILTKEVFAASHAKTLISAKIRFSASLN